MRAVNLLPEADRAPEPARAVAGSGRALLAILAVMLLATVAYVLTTNQISSRTDEIAKARSDIEAAQAEVGALGPFAAFAQVKETRLASVRELAEARFDWERFMRELALVLPEGSSVSEVTASTAGAAEDATATSTTPSTSTAGEGSPSVTLTGCATGQREVAVMLVRLRQLHRAGDVQLASSARQSSEGSSSEGSSLGSTGGAAGGTDSCGSDGYAFDATVTFGPEPARSADGADRAPARLGGGS